LFLVVLENAIYFKAQQAGEFSILATKPQPIRFQGGAAQEVPTVFGQTRLSHSRREGACAPQCNCVVPAKRLVCARRRARPFTSIASAPSGVIGFLR